MKKIILILLALVLTIGAEAQRGNGIRRASSIDDFAATCEQSFTEERIAWVFSHQGHASGIRAVLREPKAETFVTLSGLRTNVPRWGVVIKDGNKMIIK
jgi:hypothetical protein